VTITGQDTVPAVNCARLELLVGLRIGKKRVFYPHLAAIEIESCQIYRSETHTITHGSPES